MVGNYRIFLDSIHKRFKYNIVISKEIIFLFNDYRVNE